MKIIERRIVIQEWFESDSTKIGWDSDGWKFEDNSSMDNDWTVVSCIEINKFGNPTIGVAERERSFYV